MTAKPLFTPVQLVMRFDSSSLHDKSHLIVSNAVMELFKSVRRGLCGATQKKFLHYWRFQVRLA